MSSTKRTETSDHKVFWSESERASIIKSAIDTQRTRPDLSGLPLLRSAMKTLPEHRRRKILSLSQVSWFEIGVKEEISRRESLQERLGDLNASSVIIRGYATSPDNDPYIPLFSKMLTQLEILTVTVSLIADHVTTSEE